MHWDVLLVEREEGVAIATLNRPEKLNAFNKDLVDEFRTLLELLETDRNLRALIVAGTGAKAFCVGSDLKEQQGMNEKDMLSRVSAIREVFSRLEELPVPVIAAIEGMALGVGFELSLACDLRVASSSAIVGLADVELGVVPGCGGTQRLSRMVGAGRALEMVLLGRRLGAKEACDYGIIHQVVGPGEAVIQARRWVEKIRESGPVAIRQAKRIVRSGWDCQFEDGLKLELQGYKECLRSADRLEGLKAFFEKRKPVYFGK